MFRQIDCRPALAIPMAALALAASCAQAAPTEGPADASFYNVPVAAPAGVHGDLVSYRSAAVKLGPTAPATNAWNVVYQSTDAVGKKNHVSGTVLVPKSAWTGAGARPVILYAVGTHGLANGCAPSRQFEKGTDYENANIAAALKAGYAVLVSDYAGYLNGESSSYLVGRSQAHAVLDMFKASTSIPSSGITADSKVAIWGYAQGGQSAAWAAEVLPTYTPELNVVGVAAGGIPADLIHTAFNLDSNLGAGFLFSAFLGLSVQYPVAVPVKLITTDAGKAAFNKLKTQCIFTALFEQQNKPISDYAIGGALLEDLVAVAPTEEVLLAQNLGSTKVTVPLYQYHGQADEFIPLDQDIALKKKYCAKFSNVTFDLYPSEHIVTQFQAAPTVLSWLGDRFAGKVAKGNCDNKAPEPKSTANPGGGDFVVSLTSWPLDAKVGLKTLGQTVNLPKASTFTADANITAQTLNGALHVPDFKQTLRIVGLPISVGLKIVPVGAATGTASFDTEGILHVHGKVKVNLIVSSVLGIPFGECKTVTPVEFPLDFDGPISSLGNGGLTFKGTTTFPQIKGCLISGILTALMSGSGQSYSFTVAPPAPVRY